MRVWVKLDEARKIVTPHLADKEIPQHVALGYVRYPLPPVIGWAPLLVLVVFQLLGRASTGVLGWVMALAWALLVNGLFTRRYLVATTSERFLLISLARLRKRERKNASWPLAQVGAEGLKEGKSRVRFNFRIANKRLRLDLADTYLENNKSSAAAIYQALLKGRGDTLPAPKWLRKEQLLDRVVIILAVIVPLVLVMVGVGILSGTELQQRVAGLLRGKL